MYPAFLRGLVYKGSMSGSARQCAESLLANEEPGSFAFYQFTKQATETSGIPGAAPTPITMERALGLTGGHVEFARLMMTQTDESQVGMVFVSPQRQLKYVRLNCDLLNRQFRDLAHLLEDMRSNGFAVDPQKMHFPGMMYSAMAFE